MEVFSFMNVIKMATKQKSSACTYSLVAGQGEEGRTWEKRQERNSQGHTTYWYKLGRFHVGDQKLLNALLVS